MAPTLLPTASASDSTAPSPVCTGGALPMVHAQIDLGGRLDHQPGEHRCLPHDLDLQPVGPVGGDQLADGLGEVFGIEVVGEQVDVVGLAITEAVCLQRITTREDEAVRGQGLEAERGHPGLQRIHGVSLPGTNT